jgi:histidine triad (HIT) family protein
MENCIFCKIATRQIPATFIAENDDIFVIKDIHPKAPIHYLIIPKKHVVDVQSLTSDELSLMSKMAAMAQQLSLHTSTSLSMSDKEDFRLVINSGHAAGQRVFHLHMHYLAGGLKAEI